MKINYVMGIDPGKTGAWVLLDAGHAVRDYGVMPVVGGEICVSRIADLLSEYPSDEILVVLEKVHSMPGQGVKSVFTFGEGYGRLQGMCQTLKIRYEFVAPSTWKSLVLRGTKKDKDAAINYAQRRYPEINLTPGQKKKPHDGLAEALCIALWGIKTQI